MRSVGNRSNALLAFGSMTGAVEWMESAGLNLPQVGYAKMACNSTTKTVIAALR